MTLATSISSIPPTDRDADPYGRPLVFSWKRSSIGLDLMEPAKFPIRAVEDSKGARMSDQERWLNEILDILGLPRDTPYRGYTRELIERSTSVEQIYRTLRSRLRLP